MKTDEIRRVGEVWIFAEAIDGRLADVSLELLTKGRELADKLETKLSSFLIGSNVKGLARFVKAPSSRFSSTVRPVNSPRPSGTREIPRSTITSAPFPSTREPRNSTRPEAGRTKPDSALNTVDLPAPFDPMIE